MTRHTWRPGGATYYPMDGARQRDPLEPDDVIAALDAHMEHTGIVDAMAQEIENLRAELDGRAPVAPAEHWSPWLEWRGGPCPLPPGVDMDYRFVDGTESPGMSHRAHWGATADVHWAIGSFRYRAADPAGWLPRGEFIPPAELWDEGCPVRCEWVTCMDTDSSRPGIGRLVGNEWRAVTHIRLVARQPQEGVPEWWWISEHGDLMSPSGRTIFVRENCTQYTPAAIRQAVDAWLREMGDE